MSTPTFASPPVASVDDYAWVGHVDASMAQVLEAVSDEGVICRWWTAATSSERRGDDVQLFTADGRLLVRFTVQHVPGTKEVAWAVTGCVVGDWVGTTPTFSWRPGDGGTCVVEFRHIGLRPSLECFEMCRAGWNHFMPSLLQFLETGIGRPNSPRDPSA
jgi:hypothetical protein